MLFYTTSTFRETLAALTKKGKDGYMSVTKDVCKGLTNMPDNILRENQGDRNFYTRFYVPEKCV